MTCIEWTCSSGQMINVGWCWVRTAAFNYIPYTVYPLWRGRVSFTNCTYLGSMCSQWYFYTLYTVHSITCLFAHPGPFLVYSQTPNPPGAWELNCMCNGILPLTCLVESCKQGPESPENRVIRSCLCYCKYGFPKWYIPSKMKLESPRFHQ